MTETTPLVGQGSSEALKKQKRQIHIYFGVISLLFTVPQIAAQIVIYDLLFDVVCRSSGIPAAVCLSEPLASETVANILSTVSLQNGIIATVITAIMSVLSDRMGRKVGLLWFMVFSTLGILAYPVISYHVPEHATYWRMVIPYMLVALGGTPTLMLNLSVLHITDVLPDPLLRTQYLAWFLGSLMLCQATAPGLGGAILAKFGLSTEKYLIFCALWMSVGTVIMAFTFPAKHEDEEEEQISIRKQLTSFLRDAVDTISFKNAETPLQRRNGVILLVNFFFNNEFSIGFIDLIMIYAKLQFHWVAESIGHALFYMFSVRTAWALLGFPIMYRQLTKLWPAHSDNVDRADLVHMLLSNILSLLGFLILALAKSSSQYMAGAVVIANDGIAGPIWINAILKHVAEGERGRFMAALGLVVKPAGTFLPGILMKIFQLTLTTIPNFVFFVVTGMAMLVTLSVLWLRPSHQN